MTVAATVPINTYQGTGGNVTFPFTFPVFNSSQLVVTVANSSTGQSFVLTLGSDYTVAGLNSTGSPASTGSVSLLNSGGAWIEPGPVLSSAYSITIQRILPVAQLASIRNQGDFYQEFLEDALDYIVMTMQQINSGGVVLTDIVTGLQYQVVMVNGVLSTQQI